MKKIIVSIALALLCTAAISQENKITNNIMLGGGLFLESGYDASSHNPGAVMRLSYGLDIPVAKEWSVMTGAGIRSQLSDILHIGWVGGDPRFISYADLFLVARYHVAGDKGQDVIFGLGPDISIVTSPDTYYIDADPNDPRNGKETFKRYDVGLQPSVMFRKKHFQWGFEANIGLLNVMEQYPEFNQTGSIHFYNVMAVCGFFF